MDKALGRRLRALRQRAGLSATALAGDRLSVATISRIEHGAVAPSLATLRYLAGRLGCSAADLLAPDTAAAEARALLDQVEARLLLEQPAQAPPIASEAERLSAADGDAAPSAELAALRVQLTWAVARAEARLDPSTAPTLDAALGAARQARDAWAVGRLAVVRSDTLDATDASRLLHGALAGLPGRGDAPEEAVVRAQLALLLARCEERGGALETARGLYSRAEAGADAHRLPASAARRLLDGPPRGASPPLVLAATAAAQRVWTAAMLALARLDLQAGRASAAARRLRQVPFTAGGWADLAADVAAEARRLAQQFPVAGADGANVDPSWLPLEGALRAGELEEAEREALLLAASLGADAADLAHDLWLRLAQAWAEAGNAPRAAHALRAARAVSVAPVAPWAAGQ